MTIERWAAIRSFRIAVLLAASGLTSEAWSQPSVPPRTRGPHAPPPVLDLGLGDASLVPKLEFHGDAVTLRSSAVVPGVPRGRRGNPPLLRFKLRDQGGSLLEEFN